MGFLSFILAISIVVFHAYPIFGYVLVPTEIAVYSFFIISGFLISYVLNEKYVGKRNSYKFFIINRIFRIYPLYWTILFLTFAFSLFKFFATAGGSDNAITNQILPILKGDTLSFLNYILKNTTLIISYDFITTQFAYFFVGPQMWFIQIEMLFYLLAPFVLKQNLLAAIVLTLIFLFLRIRPEILLDFFSNTSLLYLFSQVFVFFLLGRIAYSLYTLIKKQKTTKKLLTIIFISFVIFSLVFGLIHISGLLFYIALVLALPFLFLFSKAYPLDRTFGRLAYPVFLSHILVIKLVNQFMQKSFLYTILVIIFTVTAAYFLLKMIDEPLNRWRQNRLKKLV